MGSTLKQASIIEHDIRSIALFDGLGLPIPDWMLGDLCGSQEHHHYVDVD